MAARFTSPHYTLVFYAVLIICWFRHYFWAFFSGLEVPSVDLNGHIAAINDLAQQLPWRFTFYDRNQFTGWPAFQFYAFLTHLVAAIVAIILSPFVSDAARLSAYLVMIGCSAALPAAFYYCTRPLVDDIAAAEGLDPKQTAGLRTLLAYSSGAFGFWFVNHDGQWHGIGAASTMNIGLFSHGTGLLLLLINLGLLFRLILAPEHFERCAARRLAWTFALLFLSHSLSALVALGAGLFAVIWYPGKRRLIAWGYGLGLAATFFWTLPHLAFSGSYVVLDIIKPEGDFLRLFFRYPLWWLARGLAAIRQGAYPRIDPTNLLLFALLLFLLLDGRIRRSRIILPFFSFVLALILIASSAYTAHSIPLGLHYYRSSGYAFLILTALFIAVSVVPAVTPAGPPGKERWLALLLVLISFGITSAQIIFPHYERKRIVKETGPDPHVNEARLLEYLRLQPQKGRVYVQYFSDYEKYVWLDAHYLASHLKTDTGFESMNGLFIQSSIAQLFPSASATMLGLSAFSPQTVFIDKATVDDPIKVDQLRSFGITHLIVGDNKVQRLAPLARGPILTAGQYRIVPIADKPRPLLEPVRSGIAPKRIIGYRDLTGDLPFHYLEYYFYSRRDLWAPFELVDLTGHDRLPAGLDAVMVNSSADDLSGEPFIKKFFADPARPVGDLNFPVPLIRLRYRPKFAIDHYSVWYQDNYQYDEYQAAAKALDNNAPFRISLLSLPIPQSAVEPGEEVYSWSDSGQEVQFSGLRPGVPYRFNFSYFPYWQPQGGKLYRASAERMIIVPDGSSMSLYYSRLTFTSTWIGCLVSLMAVVVQLLDQKKDRRSI